jgi:hypothetical protein
MENNNLFCHVISFLFMQLLGMCLLLQAAAAIKKTQEILAVKETLKKKQEEKRKVSNEAVLSECRDELWWQGSQFESW